MGTPRVYQAWKGNNKFFCGGRVIFGPDYKSFFVTILLITGPCVLFYTVVGKYLMDHISGGVAILVVAVLLAAWDLLLLILTSSHDPGIIPRNLQPPEIEDDPDNLRSFSNNSDSRRMRLPRTRDVAVNGVTVKVKYCDTCMLYRPPRCSHCSICNNCVERFDHHCPWVGQCIGRKNYRWFFLFVLSTSILCVYVFTFSAITIRLIMSDRNTNILQAVGFRVTGPVAVVLMGYTFIAVWFTGGLTVFHSYLMWTNQTTYENFRFRYENRVNPFNRGPLNNIREVLCTHVSRSMRWFRDPAAVEPDGLPVTPLSDNVSGPESGALVRSDVALVGAGAYDSAGIGSPLRSPSSDTGVEVGGVVMDVDVGSDKPPRESSSPFWAAAAAAAAKKGNTDSVVVVPEEAYNLSRDGLAGQGASDLAGVSKSGGEPEQNGIREYPDVVVDFYKREVGKEGGVGEERLQAPKEPLGGHIPSVPEVSDDDRGRNGESSPALGGIRHDRNGN